MSGWTLVAVAAAGFGWAFALHWFDEARFWKRHCLEATEICRRNGEGWQSALDRERLWIRDAFRRRHDC
jgi:hypothetical protein